MTTFRSEGANENESELKKKSLAMISSLFMSMIPFDLDHHGIF
jgi:hypothetical protein